METHFEGVSESSNGVAPIATGQNSPLNLPAGEGGEAVNAAVAYLAELQSEDSRRAVKSRLNVAARWLGFPDASVCSWEKLRFVHVVAFMHELSDKRNLAATSVNAYLSALKGVAETAWRLRQIDLLTYSEIKAVKQLRVHREPAGRSLSGEESKKLLAAAESETGPRAVRDQAVLALLLGCGLRRAEVTTLRAEHLKLGEGVLRVIGKGNKERRVFLTPEVSGKVAAWLMIRGTGEGWLFGRLSKSGRLNNTQPLDPASVGRIVGRAMEASGIDAITTHDLRRTFATRLLAKNVDIVAVKNLMGHANVTTTAKYDRRSEAALQRAAQMAEL